MSEDVKQGSFSGWAIVEMMGHQREIGYVTTEAYGQAVLFRVDTPELPEREFVLKHPEYAEVGSGDALRRWCPAGSKVKRAASPARSRLVAPGSLYALNPCTEAAARTALESTTARPLILIEVPEKLQLGPSEDEIDAEFLDDDDLEINEEEGEEVGSEEETTVSSSDPTASKGSAA